MQLARLGVRSWPLRTHSGTAAARRRGAAAAMASPSPPPSPRALAEQLSARASLGGGAAGAALGATPANRAAARAVRLAHASAAPPAQPAPPAAPPALPVAADGEGYRLPPPEIAAFVERPESPNITLSPNRDLLLYLHRPSAYPPVAELGREELKLGGLRVDPAQNTRSRMGYNTALELAPMPPGGPPGPARPITGVPPGAWLNFVSWSPTGLRVAFTVRGSGEPGAPPRAGLALWVADVDTCQARPVLPNYWLNTTFEEYSWLDDDTLVAPVVPPARGPAPVRPATPRGPRVQSSAAGVAAQARTYTDLLRDSHDASLFAHYCTALLLRVPVAPGDARPVAPLGAGATPRLYSRIDASNDGRFLIVEFLEPPFSYLVPCGRFPKRVQLWRSDGTFVREIAALPLAEAIPIVNDSCRAGRRGVSWRADAPATLYWAEAQDGGDPRVAVPDGARDVVYALDVAAADAAGAAADAPPRELLRTAWRYGGVSWGDDALALAYESQYKSRTARTWAFAPGAMAAAAAAGAPLPPMRLFMERNYEDAYTDPGAPVTRRTTAGSYVLAVIEPEGGAAAGPSGERQGRRLLFQGSGATPEGNRPFMDLFDVDAAAPVRRLYESSGNRLEYPSAIVSDAGGAPITLGGLRILLTRETPTDVPQYHIVSWDAAGANRSEVQISDFPHPHPQLVAPPKEIIRYNRADGLPLNATLYTPPGWRAGVDPPLPCLLWAYPREYKSKEAAGQLRDSPHRFTSVAALSSLVWLARGYAVLDGPSLPIVAPEGQPDGEPNDTYVEQLVAGAEAAVAEAVRRGVVDARRVAVGGRSYGAFMTANLAAHAPHLFCAGVAQAGAYNRTLTPFGFQAEERTLWQVPQTYISMSPFMHADRIKTPLLLIHGEEDNNAGCFPMQSERFFAALKGHGADCRLVLLPHESHGYRGYESVLHILAEMSDWLDRHTALPPGASPLDAAARTLKPASPPA